jgi:hypothetical protein
VRGDGECPKCRAPKPGVGTTEHAWDCLALGKPDRFDWDQHIARYPDRRIADTKFTPLPPMATLPKAEKAALAALLRECQRGWASF